MAFWNKFPYSNFHELNLDWIIDSMKTLLESQNTLITEFNKLDAKFDSLKKEVLDNIDGTAKSEVDKLAQQGAFDSTLLKLFNKIDYINTLKNKSILVFGDSISDNTFRGYNKWTYYFEQMCNKIEGCKFKNVSTAGYQLSRILTNIDGESGANPDIIILFGGINDYRYNTPLGNINDSATNTFNGALNNIYSKFVAKYPKAKVFVISPLKNAVTTNSQSAYVPLPLYAGVLSEKCKRFGWEFVDAYNNAPLIGTYTTAQQAWYDSADGTAYLHPSVQYSPYLAQFIMGCVVSGHGIPLTDFVEICEASQLNSWNVFKNTNAVFTPNTGSDEISRIMVGTNWFEVRITYNIASNSKNVFATLATLPVCLQFLMNKIVVPSTVTLTEGASADVLNVMLNNNGLILAQGTAAKAVNNVSFTAHVDNLYSVTNR